MIVTGADWEPSTGDPFVVSIEPLLALKSDPLNADAAIPMIAIAIIPKMINLALPDFFLGLFFAFPALFFPTNLVFLLV